MSVQLVMSACVIWVVAAVILAGPNGMHWEDAIWWPIHLVKILLKSLYRALFKGWA